MLYGRLLWGPASASHFMHYHVSRRSAFVLQVRPSETSKRFFSSIMRFSVTSIQEFVESVDKSTHVGFATAALPIASADQWREPAIGIRDAFLLACRNRIRYLGDFLDGMRRSRASASWNYCTFVRVADIVGITYQLLSLLALAQLVYCDLDSMLGAAYLNERLAETTNGARRGEPESPPQIPSVLPSASSPNRASLAEVKQLPTSDSHLLSLACRGALLEPGAAMSLQLARVRLRMSPLPSLLETRLYVRQRWCHIVTCGRQPLATLALCFQTLQFVVAVPGLQGSLSALVSHILHAPTASGRRQLTARLLLGLLGCTEVTQKLRSVVDDFSGSHLLPGSSASLSAASASRSSTRSPMTQLLNTLLAFAWRVILASIGLARASVLVRYAPERDSSPTPSRLSGSADSKRDVGPLEVIVDGFDGPAWSAWLESALSVPVHPEEQLDAECAQRRRSSLDADVCLFRDVLEKVEAADSAEALCPLTRGIHSLLAEGQLFEAATVVLQVLSHMCRTMGSPLLELRAQMCDSALLLARGKWAASLDGLGRMYARCWRPCASTVRVQCERMISMSLWYLGKSHWWAMACLEMAASTFGGMDAELRRKLMSSGCQLTMSRDAIITDSMDMQLRLCASFQLRSLRIFLVEATHHWTSLWIRLQIHSDFPAGLTVVGVRALFVKTEETELRPGKLVGEDAADVKGLHGDSLDKSRRSVSVPADMGTRLVPEIIVAESSGLSMHTGDSREQSSLSLRPRTVTWAPEVNVPVVEHAPVDPLATCTTTKSVSRLVPPASVSNTSWLETMMSQLQMGDASDRFSAHASTLVDVHRDLASLGDVYVFETPKPMLQPLPGDGHVSVLAGELELGLKQRVLERQREVPLALASVDVVVQVGEGEKVAIPVVHLLPGLCHVDRLVLPPMRRRVEVYVTTEWQAQMWIAECDGRVNVELSSSVMCMWMSSVKVQLWAEPVGEDLESRNRSFRLGSVESDLSSAGSHRDGAGVHREPGAWMLAEESVLCEEAVERGSEHDRVGSVHVSLMARLPAGSYRLVAEASWVDESGEDGGERSCMAVGEIVVRSTVAASPVMSAHQPRWRKSGLDWVVRNDFDVLSDVNVTIHSCLVLCRSDGFSIDGIDDWACPLCIAPGEEVGGGAIVRYNGEMVERRADDLPCVVEVKLCGVVQVPLTAGTGCATVSFTTSVFGSVSVSQVSALCCAFSRL
jgi:hypothetical protein